MQDTLERGVDDIQPALFGVGVLKLRSPVARSALVQHGPYEIAQDIFVHFVNHDDRHQMHRAEQGFRRGWLMLLGGHTITVMIRILQMQWGPLGSFIIGITLTLQWIEP